MSIFLKIFLVTTLLSINTLFAQDTVIIDQIVAQVGASIIKRSDIENQYQQYKQEGYPVGELTVCKILEDVLYQKILIDQAEIDSIVITEKEVDDEIQRRIDVFAEQIGSYKKLEKFYEKSVLEIKSEWRNVVQDQMLAQRMQQSLISEVEVSPKDVREFFEELTADSLPLINPQYEIAQIVLTPKVTVHQKLELKRKLEAIRERAVNGESFSTLAVLYSDDMGSAKNGGDLGYVARGELVPEFSATAFKLKQGEVSHIVETEYGYHIIKMVDRKGERIDVRHILLKPKPTAEDIQATKFRADTILSILDTLAFNKVAQYFSSDKQTRNNGGLIVNPYTGNSKFDAKQIDPMIFSNIENLDAGEISKPFLTSDNLGNQVYKIVKLVSETEAHRAGLKEDYQLIKQMAIEKKKNDILTEWVYKKQKETFIRVNPEYKNCEFVYKGWF